MFYKNWTLKKTLPYILVTCGSIGLYCAFILSLDKIRLLKNPDTNLSCSIDPILSCGNVIMSPQASAFGFPNPFLGLIGFAALITIGVALFAGANFKRWFWLLAQAGMLFAVGFVHWLFFQSVYNIGALCVYCMAVWTITITSFWYLTLHNFDQKNIKLPKGRAQATYAWVRRHHLDILMFWLILIIALILKHFWYYYGTKF